MAIEFTEVINTGDRVGNQILLEERKREKNKLIFLSIYVIK